ncbi:MAG: cytochrome c maturation protein CcmE [Phototrophicaceae bacterium]
MAELTWEKSSEKVQQEAISTQKSERWKFLLGGLLILGAIVYLMITSTINGARFFITVDEVVAEPTYLDQSVRLTGAVLGDTIIYDATTGDLSFTISHIPREFEDLAETLHQSANDPTMTQLMVVMEDTTMPDLLQHEAQAILTGELRADGSFHATELNLKCPTRFEEHTPNMLTDVREES